MKVCWRQAVSVFLLFSVVSFGQEPVRQAAKGSSDETQPAYVMRRTTHLVTVDLLVTDRDGHPVRDLKPEEIAVFEHSPEGGGKKPETLLRFKFQDRASAKDVPAEVMPKLAPGTYTNHVPALRPTIVPTILLMDGLNTETEYQLNAHREMVRMLQTVPTDMPVAVYLLGHTLRMIQDFTTDPTLLRKAVDAALSGSHLIDQNPIDDPSSMLQALDSSSEGSPSLPSGANGGPTGPRENPAAGFIEKFEREIYAENMDRRATITLDSLMAIARHVSAMPGRKSLIWVSGSFPLALYPQNARDRMNVFAGTRNYETEVQATANALTDAQVAVYPVGARGLEIQHAFDIAQSGSKRQDVNTQGMGGQLSRESTERFVSQETMEVVASDTGGRVCVNTNDLGKCAKTAMEDGSSYYEIAYRPMSDKWNGEFRKIEIKSTRPGVKLRYRRGYFAKDNDFGSKDGDKNQLARALNFDPLPSTAIMMLVQAMPAEKSGLLKYFVAIDPNALMFSREGNSRKVALEVGVAEFDKKGTMVQYSQSNLENSFTEQEYQKVKSSGITDTIALQPKEATSRLRLAVRDVKTGLIGSVDIPNAAPPVAFADKRSAPPLANEISFKNDSGATGVLDWKGNAITYRGEMPMKEAAAKFFDAAGWPKHPQCGTSALPAAGEQKSAPEWKLRFHNTAGKTASIDFAGTQVEYSGELPKDESATRFFNALWEIVHCSDLTASANK